MVALNNDHIFTQEDSDIFDACFKMASEIEDTPEIQAFAAYENAINHMNTQYDGMSQSMRESLDRR